MGDGDHDQGDAEPGLVASSTSDAAVWDAGSRLAFGFVASVLGRDEAAPGADRGKRGLGLATPHEAGTGPGAEVSRPGQPLWVYPSSPGYNLARQQHNAWR